MAVGGSAAGAAGCCWRPASAPTSRSRFSSPPAWPARRPPPARLRPPPGRPGGFVRGGMGQQWSEGGERGGRASNPSPMPPPTFRHSPCSSSSRSQWPAYTCTIPTSGATDTGGTEAAATAAAAAAAGQVQPAAGSRGWQAACAQAAAAVAATLAVVLAAWWPGGWLAKLGAQGSRSGSSTPGGPVQTPGPTPRTTSSRLACGPPGSSSTTSSRTASTGTPSSSSLSSSSSLARQSCPRGPPSSSSTLSSNSSDSSGREGGGLGAAALAGAVAAGVLDAALGALSHAVLGGVGGAVAHTGALTTHDLYR